MAAVLVATAASSGTVQLSSLKTGGSSDPPSVDSIDVNPPSRGEGLLAVLQLQRLEHTHTTLHWMRDGGFQNSFVWVFFMAMLYICM